MALEIDKLLEAENGFKVTQRDDTEGPIYTGGPDIPIGLNFPKSTIYTQIRNDGVKIWRKFGDNVNDWSENDGELRSDLANFDVIVPLNTLSVIACREFGGDIIIDGELYLL